MKRLLLSLTVCFNIFSISLLTAKTYDPNNTIIIIDQKNVLSKHLRPGFKDFKKIDKGKTFKHFFTILRCLPKYKKIKKQGIEISKNTKGTANIVHEVLKWMKQKKYGDLTKLEATLLNISIPVEPQKQNVELCKTLQKRGCIVFADSDMDTIHAQIHLTKMKKCSCDLSFLHGFITITPYDIAQRKTITRNEQYVQIDKKTFATKKHKRDVEHYTIAHSIVGTTKDIVFIVNSTEEAAIARNAGYDVIVHTSHEQLRRELRTRGLL